MANQIQDTKLRYFILLFIALSPLLCNRFVHGRTNGHASTKNIKFLKHKGTVKTIKSEDGEIIDCVDIYQQPAFDHPALKNHTLQMEPSEIPSWIAGNKSNQSEMFQGLFKTVECPEKTIPIIRTQKEAIPRRIHAISRLRNQSTDAVSRAQIEAYEYALVSVLGEPSRGQYNGATGRFNVWNPRVENWEHSAAQMWIRSGLGDSLNTMEAGWIKSAPLDNVPKFFIYWTADGYQTTGCYDHMCPGFFQTNHKFVLGGTFSPLSEYNNRIQRDVTITIEKNTKTGHWWLHLQNIAIGYWPDTIFTTLQGKSAERIDWGGEITNSKIDGHHTTTQMGSGHFSDEGFGRASYIASIAYRDVDINGRFRAADPRELVPIVTSSSCYDLRIGKSNDIFYGGPGYSRTCP